MKADALSLTSLYSTVNKAYVVPDYQRPFAWDPERAIGLLDAVLDDATDEEELTSIGTFLFCAVNTQQRHPFGNNSATSNAPTVIWEVVDGQQRLTVLALTGYALQQRLKALANQGLTYSSSLEFNLMFSNYRRVGNPSVPLLIRDGDNFDAGINSDLGRTLAGFSLPGAPTPSGSISRVLNAISDWVEDKLNRQNFGRFCDHLLDKCKYVQVIADSQDIAFMMFEPLNSTSEPLTAFEVFRSKAVRELGATTSFERTLRYLSYESSRRDDVIKRSNQLVFLVAQTYSGERPRVQFVRLKKYLDGKAGHGFVKHLERGAEFLSDVWDAQAPSSVLDATTTDHLRFLRKANHTAALPVLMRYYQHDPSDLPAVTRAVSAFFALWRSVFPTNKLPEVYRSLLGKGSPNNMAIDGGRLKTVPELKSYLRGEFVRRLDAQPGNEASSWTERAAMSQAYENQALCRFLIFAEMGATLKQNLLPDDPWNDLDDIEHVLPASSNPAPPELHRLGNLTILPPEVNRSLADLGWPRKREAYQWLALPEKLDPVPATFSDGSVVPAGVRRYLTDPGSKSLPHLDKLAKIQEWNEREMESRKSAMLRALWKTFYEGWLG